MTKVSTAVLLSALLFPGCGHFYLKQKWTATVLVSVTVVCSYFIFLSAWDIANQVSTKIVNGQIPLDIASITNAVSTAMAGGNSQQIMISTWTLAICWLAGIIDAYRIARKTAARQRS